MSRLDRIRMSLGGTVARFAALDVFLAGERELGVGGFLKLNDFRLMARPATIGAGEFRWRGVEFRRPGRYRRSLLGVRHFLRKADAPNERETTAERQMPPPQPTQQEQSHECTSNPDECVRIVVILVTSLQ